MSGRFGGSGSTQQTQSTSTPVDMTPDALKALRTPFASSLTSILGGNGPQYNGPLVAPITGSEQMNLGGANAATYDPTRAGLIQKTMSGGFLPGAPGGNPFLDASINAAQRSTLQGLETTLGKTLPGRFALAGQRQQPGGSSAFDNAAAVATRGTAQALGDIGTNISSNAYNSERQLQQGAIGLGQNEVQNVINNLQAQGLPRMIQDTGIQRGMDLFKTQLSSLMQALATASGAPISQIANQGQSSGSGQSQTSPNIFNDLFGQQGAGAGSSSPLGNFMKMFGTLGTFL
jgi:hypothetical protein